MVPTRFRSLGSAEEEEEEEEEVEEPAQPDGARSVAKIASMTRKRKCLNSTWSRLTRKLYSGLDMKRFQAAAAWWFSRTERSLYSTACESNKYFSAQYAEARQVSYVNKICLHIVSSSISSKMIALAEVYIHSSIATDVQHLELSLESANVGCAL
ncbi:hypothetical protein QYF61_007658 [Mycteria americana]|uniref:Uncharacterized protein n=1 Tax=Mycteria americana TaxID=33587 RepID=A0AAN7NPZ4_MYCAM|nr:hypothetical protein QYF61_007658 [Mycteria americana]